MYKGKTLVHPLYIRCAPLVHSVPYQATAWDEGNEALFYLEMFWRNNRRHLLFPGTVFNPASQ